MNSTRSAIGARPGVQLALATWVSVINFWAWNLIGPLAMTRTIREMALDSGQISVMVATPILAGALGRLVAGPLTDRFGGRTMFTAVTLATIPPVLGVGFAEAAESYRLILVAGFFLGVGGTVFAVGIPFANNWYEPARRGFATGVFGMGMAGTAVSAFATPRLVRSIGLLPTHFIIAGALAATALLCLAGMRNGPHFAPNTGAVLPKLLAAARLRVTWEMSLLYAVLFGGFVAFSNYLPTYIHNIYGFSSIDAGSRTAAFALAAVLARPVGGALADRMPPKYVVLGSLIGVAALAVEAIFKPPRDFWSAETFILLAISLGIGTGGVFGWVTRRAPAGSLGAITGIVSAAGGFGGYFPPIVMGVTYDPVGNDYTVGLMLLVATAVAAVAYTALRLHAREPAAGPDGTAGPT